MYIFPGWDTSQAFRHASMVLGCKLLGQHPFLILVCKTLLSHGPHVAHEVHVHIVMSVQLTDDTDTKELRLTNTKNINSIITNKMTVRLQHAQFFSRIWNIKIIWHKAILLTLNHFTRSGLPWGAILIINDIFWRYMCPHRLIYIKDLIKTIAIRQIG